MNLSKRFGAVRARISNLSYSDMEYAVAMTMADRVFPRVVVYATAGIGLGMAVPAYEFEMGMKMGALGAGLADAGILMGRAAFRAAAAGLKSHHAEKLPDAVRTGQPTSPPYKRPAYQLTQR